MNQRQSSTRPSMAPPMDDPRFSMNLNGPENLGSLVPFDQPAPGNATIMSTTDGIITAQRVAVPRNIERILQNMKVKAKAFGDQYIYRLPFKNNRNGRTDNVEGATIKLANDLAREYGNCQVDVRVMDEPDCWMFYARFVDYETGFSLTRAYRQRKNQGTGMKDAERQLDMVFQIGQSKAERNVIVNALQTLVDYVLQEAKDGLRERVSNNPEGARAKILELLERLGIELKRVQAVYGRTADKWTVPDMVRIMTELKSISEGMVNAEDLYPAHEDQAEEGSDGQEQQQSSQQSTTTTNSSSAAPETKAAGPETRPAPPETKAEAEETTAPKAKAGLFSEEA